MNGTEEQLYREYLAGDGTLNPGGSTTRAQIAALFMRLCERVLD